jgi:transcription-repair coupling factor (superfamily II helicase)
MHEQILLKVGENHTFKDLITSLTDFGYEKVSPISNPGDFSLAGDTLKIFPTQAESPLVISFFGNAIEQIHTYSIELEKRVEKLSQCIIDRNKLRLTDNSIISPGDFIVHEDYGVGLFRRISIKEVEAEKITYFEIEYLNNSILLVPESQIDKLSKYVGIGQKKPKLNKLGSVAWKKNYKKVYDDILQVARELLSIYAKRMVTKKIPRVFNGEWDKRTSETFGFTETKDQKKAIGAVFDDLSVEKPMDRLLCGDVGFGKTEVALRGSVQSVANGYQVAILVPTTLLAEQHFSTFRERLKSLPINIERLSRFVPDWQQREIKDRCKSGNIDIIIGTHSILRQNIEFNKLGLLVIDEEQKFGVKDKEKLKKYREVIDVLSLTATPIPRTLFMSLSGLRDISLISSVPSGRLPVKTEVAIFDKEVVKENITRELERGGQVYYLHNRVSTIISVKRWLEKEFPLSSVGIAHGQMDEIGLAKVMRDFAERRIDILVCSTIIENGLDLPNVNTLIADESDKFGLSQLYQIRGRIGRSVKQAYALFTYRDKNITKNAIRRLKAIVENTDLGTGYNIALEDLEIRGGGNILGKKQHGSMESVGLVLYSKLLSQAVSELKQK